MLAEVVGTTTKTKTKTPFLELHYDYTCETYSELASNFAHLKIELILELLHF